jgi:hypothetical protein
MEIGVLTSYFINGNKYASYVLGKSMDEVMAVIEMRGLGEIIESGLMEIENTLPDYSQLSDSDFIARLPEIMHSMSFLSFVAASSKTVSAKELLGDEGLLHELTHLNANLQGCYKKSLTCIRDLIKTLQRKAIGYYPV